MEDFIEALKHRGFEGDLDSSDITRQAYSHDASLFEVVPQLVVYPKHETDLQRLITTLNDSRRRTPSLALTARSAGTDMSGAAIGESVVVDMNRYFGTIEEVTSLAAHVQPGVFYRDFEKETLKHSALMPSFPASRELATVGGMVANNAGGEKSLEFGKTENFVTGLRVILSDGKSYELKALNTEELKAKQALPGFEGQLYRQMFILLDGNYDKIKAAKPKVTKNSTGYNLWDVWDRQTGIFDLTKLFVGSQGTLGLITDINFSLVPARKHSGLLVVFLKDIDRLGEIINVVLAHKPATFESFDDVTLKMSIKFMPYFLKMLGLKGFLKLVIGLIPDGLILLKGIPKLILMVEFDGETVGEVRKKIHVLDRELFTKRAYYEIEGEEEDPTESKSEKFWILRRQSFNLLRKKVKDKHTAPFIDDLVVQPKYLPEFLPKLRAIIDKYKLFATVAGHMGDGNFHVIPLMKIEQAAERAKLAPAMKEVNDLVLSYGGSLSGEHNDGMIRGPWLERMYGKEVVDLFKQTKRIFDPNNIFNPYKKTDANWDYSMSHIRDHF